MTTCTNCGKEISNEQGKDETYNGVVVATIYTCECGNKELDI